MELVRLARIEDPDLGFGRQLGHAGAELLGLWVEVVLVTQTGQVLRGFELVG